MSDVKTQGCHGCLNRYPRNPNSCESCLGNKKGKNDEKITNVELRREFKNMQLAKPDREPKVRI